MLSGYPGGWHLGAVFFTLLGRKRGTAVPVGLSHHSSQSSYILDLSDNLILQTASQTRNQGHLQRLPFLDPPSQHQSTPAASNNGFSLTQATDASWLNFLQSPAASCIISQLVLLDWAWSQSCSQMEEFGSWSLQQNAVQCNMGFALLKKNVPKSKCGGHANSRLLCGPESPRAYLMKITR